MATRPLHKIASDIQADWKNVNFAAAPYLDAMKAMEIGNTYGVDSGKDIVLYFLSNASAWRGDVAREIKNELKGMFGIR